MATQLRHLRSGDADKRPAPEEMVAGQIAINYSTGSPGLFFRNAAGQIQKVGPTHVGLTAPNSSPSGSPGVSVGESWLDTSLTPPVFKVWSGTEWVAVSSPGGGCEVGETAPTAPEPGDLWFRTDICQLFVWYDDGDTQQWVQANSGGGGGSSSSGCHVGETPPDAPADGDLWFRTDICQLFVWYDDGDTQQWVQANSGGGGSGGGDVTPIAAGEPLPGPEPPTPVDGMTDVNEAQAAATAAANSTAYSLLQPTDWAVVREVETGISKRSAISNYRADVRAAADEKVAAIAALTTVEEVQDYLRGDAYATWPSEELLTKD